MRNFKIRKLLLLNLLILLLISGVSFAEKQDRIRIAIATDGKKPTASVSQLAGRCPYYLLFDEQGTFIEAIENPFKTSRGGAGISAVDFLAQKGVKIIVAESFGNKMISAMKSRGIKYYEFRGDAADAVKMILGI
jgi:predicted Fe-Mo cluster-binding NifX family protein